MKVTKKNKKVLLSFFIEKLPQELIYKIFSYCKYKKYENPQTKTISYKLNRKEKRIIKRYFYVR